MSLGEVFRRSREQRGLSQRELAARANVSSSFITRLERNLTNPTWRAIEAVAAALGSAPRLRLVPDESAVQAAGRLVSQARPIDRLRKQPVNILGTLAVLDECGVPFVAIGAVAGLLQGFPTPASDLQVLVEDTDAALLALQRILLGEGLLFEELEPEELRSIVQRSWPIDDCEMQVSLVDELPEFVTVELLSDLVVRVLPPHALLTDEEVASTLRISTMGSSDP